MENSVIKMLERFGVVCYWAACALAVLAFYFGWNGGALPEDREDVLLNFFTGFFYALPVWLCGVALQYIFTGRGFSKKNPSD